MYLVQFLRYKSHSFQLNYKFHSQKFQRYYHQLRLLLIQSHQILLSQYRKYPYLLLLHLGTSYSLLGQKDKLLRQPLYLLLVKHHKSFRHLVVIIHLNLLWSPSSKHIVAKFVAIAVPAAT